MSSGVSSEDMSGGGVAAGGPGHALSIEQAEEAKLAQKYPNLGRKGIGSSVLQQRLSSKGGQKYFDSGDYNMAKAKVVVGHRAPPRGDSDLLQAVTGETIATPDSVPAVRKKSLVGDQLLLAQAAQHRKPSIACTDESMATEQQPQSSGV